MMTAVAASRCDGCESLGIGSGAEWYDVVWEDDQDKVVADLCNVCAPPVIEFLRTVQMGVELQEPWTQRIAADGVRAIMPRPGRVILHWREEEAQPLPETPKETGPFYVRKEDDAIPSWRQAIPWGVCYGRTGMTVGNFPLEFHAKAVRDCLNQVWREDHENQPT